MTKLYSGFFLDSPIHGKIHATWVYGPGTECPLPEGVKEGDEVFIDVVGDYCDKDVEALIVNVVLQDGTVLSDQPCGTVLHITTRVGDGFGPVVSGLRATEYGWVPRGEEGRKYVRYIGRAGFHKV